MKKGWIALDIDGTVTDARHSIPPGVRSYLKKLSSEEWNLVFLTGRTFSYSFSALKELDFPYFLVVQNGADLLKMPERMILYQNYLETSILSHLEQIYSERKEDFLIYAGYEHGDFCYYRPYRFSLELLAYLEEIKALSPEPWEAMDDFRFSQGVRFPLIKCIGKLPEMQEVQQQLLRQGGGLQVTLIRDVMTEELFLNLVTNNEATKGKALKYLIDNDKSASKATIAAGDDYNDLSMLDIANVRIVMETAPQEMIDRANIVAKSASQQGIIAALEQAIPRLSH